jgi:hypothetical protein
MLLPLLPTNPTEAKIAIIPVAVGTTQQNRHKNWLNEVRTAVEASIFFMGFLSIY